MLARMYGSAARLATRHKPIELPTLPSLPNANNINLRLDADVQRRTMQETAFADGLRGIAALYVVASHLVLCYARGLVNPCCAPGSEQPQLLQRPIFRLFASGHSWVAVFFILLGFVNALKPISLIRNEQVDTAASKLAASSLSRIFRLFFPATFATVGSWFICQFGLYEMARHSDAFWLQVNTPAASPNIFAAIGDLRDALINTWKFGGDNQYDQPQWAIIYLLQGSLMTIIALLVTANMTSLWRTVSLCLLALSSVNWSHVTLDPYIGLACFGGIIMAEFSVSAAPTQLTTISPYLSPPIAIFALVLMSYPSEHPEGSPWSASLQSFALTTFGDLNIERLYGTIGGLFLLFSIIISPHARHLLSRPPLRWLGKVSFAIYLLHGTILRSLFAWLLHFGTQMEEYQEFESKGDGWAGEVLVSHMRYPVPSFFRCCVATTVSMAAILATSHLWSEKVEPVCAALTGAVEKLVKGKLSKEEAIDVISVGSRTPLLEEKGGLLLPIRQD
jgi:peptidoglycan/LPS O-acetylase OafA/YrhL